MATTRRRGGGSTGLRVRMYRVGFGDFFLISVPTDAGPRHILVDCGVHAGNLGTIEDAVEDLATATGKRLALVIVTHRHADHISGFARCAEQFRGFEVDRIWMSWWDDPENARANAFQLELTALARELAARLAASGDRELVDMMNNATGDGSPGGNAAALELLRNQGFKRSPRPDYYQAGDRPALPPDLVRAGLEAVILGPPISPELMAQMRDKSQEYLTLGVDEAPAAGFAPFADRWRARKADIPPETLSPDSAAQMVAQLEAVQPDVLAARARQVDKTINNQSLIVLFRFRGKSLLFVGDAQWGNWSNFLYGGSAEDSEDLLPRSAELLAKIDFYKVGHHGSTNATPIAAVEAMRSGMVAMCSTQEDCYNEVPRAPLLEALSKKTKGRLACSDQVPAGDEKANADRGKLPAAFKTPGKLYIDYVMKL